MRLAAPACLLLAAASLVWPSGGPAVAEEHRFGPLPAAEAWLGGGSGFLSLPVEAPPESRGDAPDGRGWKVTASLDVSSFWLRSPAVSEVIEARPYRGAVTPEYLDGIDPWPGAGGIYFADAELHRLTLDLRRQVGRRLEVGVRTGLLNADGGVMDPLIEGFHDFFGFRQSGRPQTLENGYTLYFRRDGPGGRGDASRVVRARGPGPGITETTFLVKAGVGPESGAWRQGVQLQVKMPTASDGDFRGTGSVDAAVQYLLSRRLRRWTLHGNAGFTRLGRHELLGLASQNIVTVAVAGERPTGPRSSMVLQLRHQQSPFRQLNLSILGVTATLMDVGWTRRIGPGRTAWFSLTNNTAKYGSAVDLSLQTGLRWRPGTLRRR